MSPLLNSNSATDIAGPIITQPPFFEPDCHDHFQPIFQHNDLCRASLGERCVSAVIAAASRWLAYGRKPPAWARERGGVDEHDSPSPIQLGEERFVFRRTEIVAMGVGQEDHARSAQGIQ